VTALGAALLVCGLGHLTVAVAGKGTLSTMNKIGKVVTSDWRAVVGAVEEYVTALEVAEERGRRRGASQEELDSLRLQLAELHKMHELCGLCALRQSHGDELYGLHGMCGQYS
jgi:hypothetical protein